MEFQGRRNIRIEKSPIKGSDFRKRFDWGLMLNAGVEVKRFTLNVSYDMGLDKEYRYDDISIKYHTVSFTVGYRF